MNVPIFPDNINLSRPFHFTTENADSKARIGGNMPEELSISLNENAQYFGTFPLYDNESPLYFSLFINCSFKEFVVDWHGRIKDDSKVVVALHEYRPRSKSTQYASRLKSQHSIEILKTREDIYQSDTGELVVREGHKFGGAPYCIQEPKLIGWEELLAQGYRQILQIDFPGLEDGAVSGTWPFGDGIFNLFWKYPFEGEKYFWCVQS